MCGQVAAFGRLTILVPPVALASGSRGMCLRAAAGIQVERRGQAGEAHPDNNCIGSLQA